MLNGLTIKNFRSCRDVELEALGPVTTLIGRNAAGKSNVLHAIRRLAQIATASTPNELRWEEQPLVEAGVAANQKAIDSSGLYLSADIVLDGRFYRYSSLNFRRGTGPERLHFKEALIASHNGVEYGPVFERDGEAITLPATRQQVGVGINAATLTRASAHCSRPTI